MGSLSPPGAFTGPFSLPSALEEKSSFSLFRSPLVPRLFPHCWYYKIPIQNNPCHLSTKPACFPRSLSSAHTLTHTRRLTPNPLPHLCTYPPAFIENTWTQTQLQIPTAHTHPHPPTRPCSHTETTCLRAVSVAV